MDLCQYNDESNFSESDPRTEVSFCAHFSFQSDMVGHCLSKHFVHMTYHDTDMRRNFGIEVVDEVLCW
jgi:hypothetical protein